MNDLVSVIMPSFNTAAYIEQSIASVLGQSYRNWELIIVDDCSDDETDQLVRSCLQDSRIRYYRNDRNLGASACRNFALQQAKGKWIAFLDSDDLWLPEKLEKQVHFMQTHACSFSYTCYREIDAKGQPLGKTVSGPRRIGRAGFYNFCWPGCLTVMYDREVVGLIQISEIQKNNDYAMWLKICRKTDCYLLDEVLALYRRGRSGSISTQQIRTLIRWHYRLFREAEEQSVPAAVFNTCRNLFFGAGKKLIYVRRE